MYARCVFPTFARRMPIGLARDGIDNARARGGYECTEKGAVRRAVKSADGSVEGKTLTQFFSLHPVALSKRATLM